MSKARQARGRNWTTALICLFLAGRTFGDVAASVQTTSNTSGVRPELLAVVQQRQTLLAQAMALQAKGATPQQLMAWQTQNGAQLAALNQQIQALTPAPAAQPIMTVVLPPNATAEMKEFLQNRATLMNAGLQNRSSTTNAPSAAIKALLQRQATLATIMAQQQAKSHPPETPPLVIPSGVSPQMAAFMTARHQLMQDQMQLMTQYQNADPATRTAALQKWSKDNAPRVAQMQQMAQALATANTTSGAKP